MRRTVFHTTFALFVPTLVSAQSPAPAAVPVAAPTPASAPAARVAAIHASAAVAAPAPVEVVHVAIAHADEASPQRRIRTAAPPLLLQPWYPQDPADAVYRAGRDALMRGDRREAVRRFEEVQRRWPRSNYAPQSYYWMAFALSRGNASTEDLRRAREALNTLRTNYPDAEGLRDADALRQMINAQLAERGDAQSSAAVRRVASTVATQQGCSDVDDENDTRVVALNALLHMDSESALPILKQVLARRDACSAPLRRRAVFLVSQRQSSGTADVLVDLVRNDPDREVREQAIFWLSQVDGARAVDALEEILRTSRDEALQEKAVFALSQHRSSRSAELLRAYAMRTDVDEDLRAQAIFWLGQSGGQHSSFLREIYPRISSDELKEKLIFSIAQQKHSPANSEFLMEIALNRSERAELRKQALFWANQTGAVSFARMAELYDRTDDREMKDQLIFAFSQSPDPAAIEKLMNIGRNERDPELRKQAIFWLGQSKDRRVQQFLLEMINN